MPLPTSNQNPILPVPSISQVPESSPDVCRGRRPLLGRRARLRTLPLAEAPAPTATSCLKCQLVGSRRLTCSKADVCAALPHAYALGPILLAAWLATAIAFVVAVYGR